MDGIRGASIIPFTARREPRDMTTSAPAVPPAGDHVSHDEGARRLQAALASLDAAVAGQREAVARWRGALGSLGSSVQGLQASLHDYGDQLGTLRGKLDTVSAGARDLEAWADSALATSGEADQRK